MAKFNDGQQLVCINKHGWHDRDTMTGSFGPKYNEMVTVKGVSKIRKGYLILVEHEFAEDGETQYWNENQFAPLISTDDLMKALEVETFETAYLHAIKERKRSKAWI